MSKFSNWLNGKNDYGQKSLYKYIYDLNVKKIIMSYISLQQTFLKVKKKLYKKTHSSYFKYSMNYSILNFCLKKVLQ